MIPFIMPQCLSCKHRDIPIGDAQSCEAYPDGIPAEIWDGEADHRQPQPDDNGVRWESNGDPFPAEVPVE